MGSLVCIILGVISLVFGIYKLILYFRKTSLEAAMAYDLAVGILFTVLGVIVLVFQAKVLEILPIIFGIFLLISSIMKVQNAVDVKRFGGSKWWLALIFAAVSIVLAIILILKPQFVVDASFVVIGIFLIIDGAEGLASIFMYSKYYRKAKNAADGAVSGMSHGTVDADSAEVVSSVPIFSSKETAKARQTSGASVTGSAAGRTGAAPNVSGTASNTSGTASNTSGTASGTSGAASVKTGSAAGAASGNTPAGTSQTFHLNFDPDTGKPLNKK